MTTVLISGANRGLGLEFARQYVADGATVVAGARDPQAASELQGRGGVEVHTLDVGDNASVARFREAVGDRPVDILVANAGVGGGASFGELDFPRWMQVMNVNSLGPVRLAQAFIDNLKAGGEKKLVAITSVLGSIQGHSGDMLPYRASKAALNSAWAGLAVALKGDGIICLPLHPGWVKTDMGGPGAQLTPEQSVRGLRARIADAGPRDSGLFRDHAGKDIAW
jgi:NAD(P)-dependent dehydrogenase (short-subunit alcohol dehydrogenase family)